MTLSEKQHAARALGIGGSEVPIILGATKYQSRLGLWMEKTNKVARPQLDGINIEMGNRLEPIVVDLFEDRSGMKTRKQNITKVHKEFDWMRGNIDRDVIGARAGLECKAFSPWNKDEWGESGSGDVPVPVTAQCAHYMEVYDYDVWYVAVLLGIHDFRWFKLERDPTITEGLISIEREFWRCVREDEIPKPLVVGDAMKLYPSSRGESINATPEIVETVALLVEKKAEKKALDAEIDNIAESVKMFMGEASELIPETNPDPIKIKPITTWRQSKDSLKTDWKRVSLEFYEWMDEFGGQDLQEVCLRSAGGFEIYTLVSVEQIKNATLEAHSVLKPGSRSFLVK